MTTIKLRVVVSGRDPLLLSLSPESRLECVRQLFSEQRSVPLDRLMFTGELLGREQLTLRELRLTNGYPVFLDLIASPDQQLIDNQLQYEAVDNRPEHLMLYSKANGYDCTLCVDTGAQITCASVEYVTKIGLEAVIDRRCVGQMKGVGTTNMVGVIHACPIKFGNSVYSVRVSVLEKFGQDNDTDFDMLLGCDFLKARRCVIDLEYDKMRVDGIWLPLNSTLPVAPEPVTKVDPSCTQLIELFGCNYEVAQKALKRANGDLEVAAGLILGI